MGGTVKRLIAASAALVMAIAAATLMGSCNNNLTWWLQMWGELDMLEVYGGTLQLGDVEGLGYSDELPVHTVTISTFEMSRYEVTQSLYFAITGWNPSWYQESHGYPDEPCRPVETVSWQDAVGFCNALSSYAGLEPCYNIDEIGGTVTWNTGANGYRLPTEAEWEFAARGGTSSEHYMYAGSNTLDEVGRYAGNSWDSTYGEYLPVSVGSLGSNELGFYDMSGNVWEWCWDTYDPDYYWTADGMTDPRGFMDTVAYTGGLYSFVVRGGATDSADSDCRNARRMSFLDTDSSQYRGFRVARNP